MYTQTFCKLETSLLNSKHYFCRSFLHSITCAALLWWASCNATQKAKLFCEFKIPLLSDYLCNQPLSVRLVERRTPVMEYTMKKIYLGFFFLTLMSQQSLNFGDTRKKSKFVYVNPEAILLCIFFEPLDNNKNFFGKCEVLDKKRTCLRRSAE